MNSLPLRGRKQGWGKSPTLLPSVLLLGSTRVALPGCQAPQAPSDVPVQPLALHGLSFPSQELDLAQLLPPWPWNWPGCIPNPAPNNPQLFLLLSQIRVFSLGTAVCQFFQAEAMPALHFLFFPHTLTQALSVGSFLS